MRFLTLLFVVISWQIKAQSEALVFRSANELLAYADSFAIALKQQEFSLELAHLTKNAAYGNVLNPRVPVSASLTNNTNLPVNFIPAEIFGGPSGSFREVQFGQQFISVLNVAPQFDIINPGRLGDVKSASVNEDLSKVEFKLFKQNFHVQLCFIYYNLVALQEQLEIFRENVIVAQEIHLITSSKLEQGMLSRVELNDSEINLQEIKKSAEIIQLNISTQYEMLKEMLGTSKGIVIEEALSANEALPEESALTSDLFLKKYLLNESFARQSLRAARLQNLPTLSFFSSFNWQNNSNTAFFDSNQRWINSNYYGLKLTYDLPTSVSKLTNVGTLKIQKEQQQLQYSLAKVQAQTDQVQLNNDYLIALKEVQSDEKSVVLYDQSYVIQKDRFDQEILPLDKLLEAQRKLLNSKAAYASSLATLHYQRERIRINNTTR